MKGTLNEGEMLHALAIFAMMMDEMRNIYYNKLEIGHGVESK
jgi:hypothetical protein